jgi:hypothetical protein
LPNRDKLWSKSRPFILGMSKSTTKQPVRLSSGERKNSSPDENARATSPIERIKTSIAFPTASSSSTMATIGRLFGTWQHRLPRAAFTEERISSARLFLIQPKRNRYVLRLYKCIANQRLASVARNLVVHGTSCVTGIDLRITLAPVSSTRAPPAWNALEGQGRPQGVIGLGGGELHHNGTRWRSLLI